MKPSEPKPQSRSLPDPLNASSASSETNKGGPTAKKRISETYGKLPLSFEPNEGQAHAQVKFLARGNGYGLFLAPQEFVLRLNNDYRPSKVKHHTPDRNSRSTPASALKITLENANPSARIVGLDKLPGKTNYFLGKDPKNWQTNVTNYARVKYEGIYPGVDMVYYGNQRQLEYDFIVSPGADPGAIMLSFDWVRRLRIDRNGDLLLSIDGAQIRQHSPYVYQIIDGRRQQVAARYLIAGKRQIGFKVEQYDQTKPLVIDPVLSFSTYLGGTHTEYATDIDIDSSGNSYITGYTASTNFPTANPFQSTRGGTSAGLEDAFVTKLNASGDALVYSTYLGGSANDRGAGIAVDSLGNVHVTGHTRATNFPTANALYSTKAGLADAFVTVLSAMGDALVYSTYLGGSGDDEANGIAVDTSGNTLVTGVTDSTNFPTLNAFQSTFAGGWTDAFVTKLNPTGTAIVFSTYLGGSTASVDGDKAMAITVDAAGNAYVSGAAGASDFPLLNAYQTTYRGGQNDAFISKFDAAGALVYSTYLGGNGGESGDAIALDSSGNVYVTGYTYSTNFPTLNAFQSTPGGSYDSFVAKLNASGSGLIYSTYIRGSNNDFVQGIAVDSSGYAYLTGSSNSTNFPLVNPLQSTLAGQEDVFFAKLNQAGNALVFSTFLGGTSSDHGRSIALDSSYNAYVTGSTHSGNFPIVNGFQSTYVCCNGDAFVFKISGLDNYGIIGQVTDVGGLGMSAVTMTLSGSQTGTVQTDSGGNYSFPDLIPGGNYTVTPSKAPFSFAPTNQTFNNLSSNQTANFTTVTHSISGRVIDGAGNGISSATLTLSGSQTGTAQSDVDGYYTFASVKAGGTYTVTPSKASYTLTYTFTPATRNFASLSSNQTGADFTASTSTQMALTFVADAYVQDGTSAGTNFGSVTPMLIKTANQADQRRDVFLKFDLSVLSRPIVNAKLRIHAALSVAGSVATTIYKVADTTWGENTITWSNKPLLGTTLSSVTVTSTTYSTFDIDISSYVIAEKAAGRNVVSLALHNQANSTPHILLNSREAPTNKPQLIVTTTDSNNAAPTVSLTAQGGPNYTAPANITLNANASDSDGTISKVDFYAGGSLINTDNSAPYSITWPNVSVGSYSLTAVATDNAGSSTTSSTVSISVIPPNGSPTVSLTSPVSGLSFAAGSNISVSATAADVDGSITKVDFFAGGSLIGTDTTEPYSIVWSNAPVGAHALTAVATDNGNATAPSPAVNINVIWQTGLTPIADAYVRDGSSASTNFGTQPELQTQVSSTGNNRETYLRFDINTVSNIINAKLRLYGRLSDTTGSNVPASVYAVSNTVWTESGSGSITWNNKPTAGGALSSVTISDNNPRWYEWDVSTYVQGEKAANRNTITLAVKNTAMSSPYATFSSREASSTQPQLVITATATRNILFVTGSATLNAGENALKTRMENLGFTVTVKAAGSTQNTAVNTTDAAGKAAVVISSTVTPANVLAKFRHVPLPVLLWEFDLLDDQGMTESTAGFFGTEANQASLLIQDPTHPMAAGLSNTISVVTPNSAFTWGKPNANAVKIASLTGDTTRIAIFGYDSDSLMPALLPDGLPAPARRVAFFLTDTNGNSLTTPNGISLFDAAIKWLTAGSVAPTISNIDPTSGTIGSPVTLNGYNFGDSQGTSTVKFNGMTAAASSWSGTTITVTVPIGATTGPVIVTVKGRASNGISFTVNLPPVDTDGDGLPDAWELQYFGNLNQGANDDPDGDGLTNLQEYQQGRNPTKNALQDDGTGVNLKVHTPLAPPSP